MLFDLRSICPEMADRHGDKVALKAALSILFEARKKGLITEEQEWYACCLLIDEDPGFEVVLRKMFGLKPC